MNERILPFKTILFGFAFSPKLEINVLETSRIAKFFNAKLLLLHVGEKTAEKELQINTILNECSEDNVTIEVQWKQGNPIDVITKTCKTAAIDLLILGALQRENVYQFYVGSIARKLTRKVCCSVLLLIKPSAERIVCNNIVVNGLDEPDTPLAITDAFYVANALGSQQITIVEELREKEVDVTIEDDKSLKKATIMKERLTNREESRIRKIINNQCEEYTQNIRINTQNIFGQRGYCIGHYAEIVRADLLIMNAPKKTRLIDRIFPHDIEHILSDLPTDLLIIRRDHLETKK
ncbi:universal stress protein [Cellulophaga baltica]|uniref:universal stress protein n=1 Tax=Cellulophaga TaxID=104264 RepID=UPI001C0671E7|nr:MULTISPECIES: universal stress protein [Cellulophaga]MBU2995862.1 universal stress protein [Cellulophaga baltica]MDO6767257.1 universal stress protein [Cellulophaga sp. 1_MG-2023]